MFGAAAGVVLATFLVSGRAEPAAEYHPRHLAVCNTTAARNYVQRLQWERARQDLGVPRPTHGVDVGTFYSHSYGMASVDGAASEAAVAVGAGFPSHIVYYRIAGNEDRHIHTLLQNFAGIAGFRYREYTAFLKVPDGGSEVDNAFVPFKLFKSSVGRRYAFTFVRDPLARFVGAYVAAEQSSSSASTSSSSARAAPFQSTAPVGSVARVVDFIRAVLSADAASAHGLLSNASGTAPHLCAQVGALAQAQAVEKRPLRLYQVERFADEWAALAKEAGYVKWFAVASNVPRGDTHAEAGTDNNNPVAAAMAMAMDAGRRLLEVDLRPEEEFPLYPTDPPPGAPAPPPPVDLQERARHVRVVCRLYLSDYVCTEQALPAACRDLLDELDRDLAAHARETQRWARWGEARSAALAWVDPRRYISKGVLQVLAELPCAFAANPPECMTFAVYGLSPGDPEDDGDDEL